MLATSAARSPFLPEVPTLKEAGFDLVASGWYGVFAPAGTPDAVVARLSAGVAGAVQSPQVKERLLAFGLVPTGTSAAELGRHPKGGFRAVGARRQGVGVHAGAIVVGIAVCPTGLIPDTLDRADA